MEPIKVKEIVKAVNGKILNGDEESEIREISTDTRTMRKDAFFIPLAGRNFDGHMFVEEAVKKGCSGFLVSAHRLKDIDLRKLFNINKRCVAIVVEDTLEGLGEIGRYYRNLFAVEVIGITGSNGKSTTKEMVKCILEEFSPGKVLSSPGNWNNLVGIPLTLLQLKKAHKYCVLELGTNTPGEIKRLSYIISPRIGLITNIGHAHIGFFSTRRKIYEEKKALFDNLESGGAAILNMDDFYLSKYKPKAGIKCIRFSFSNKKADVYVKSVRYTSSGMEISFLCGGEDGKITLNSLSEHDAQNLISAIACVYPIGVPLDKIVNGIKKYRPLPMHMEVIKHSSGAIIINDAYNANPESMRSAISTFHRLYTGRKKYLLLGDMLELGGMSRVLHERVAFFIRKYKFDKIFLYGENMYNIAYKVLCRSKYYKDRVFRFGNMEDLSKALRENLDGNVAILLKGSRALMLEEIVHKI
jgi:UDP-N-acetylmuramoyl-tripeptide--D-alanyl-D-alanine ligase